MEPAEPFFAEKAKTWSSDISAFWKLILAILVMTGNVPAKTFEALR